MHLLRLGLRGWWRSRSLYGLLLLLRWRRWPLHRMILLWRDSRVHNVRLGLPGMHRLLSVMLL